MACRWLTHLAIAAASTWNNTTDVTGPRLARQEAAFCAVLQHLCHRPDKQVLFSSFFPPPVSLSLILYCHFSSSYKHRQRSSRRIRLISGFLEGTMMATRGMSDCHNYIACSFWFSAAVFRPSAEECAARKGPSFKLRIVCVSVNVHLNSSHRQLVQQTWD